MIGKILIAVLALGFGAAAPIAALANDRDSAVVRDEDLVLRAEDDDDGDGDARLEGDTTDDSDSFTSGVDSNDGTGSRETPVTRDRDRSRGDLTKDRTRDGAGGGKRDWSRHKTNDNSRRDTR